MSSHISPAVLVAITFSITCCTISRPFPQSNNRTERVAVTPNGPATANSNLAPARSLRQFSITVEDVEYTDQHVVVAGSAALPDGSLVIVNFDVARGSSDDYVGSDERVPIKNGKFKSKLIPKPGFPKSAPQVIEVMFTPRGQTKTITDLTGVDGEFLTGKNVKTIDGVNVIEVTRPVKLPIR
jgi:hypothetical protein